MSGEPSHVTDDERRLLDAIGADPASDAPRLAYAEWIEPTDPERAELIRLDCAHAAETPRGLVGGRTGWLEELARWYAARLREDGFSFVYLRRGFVQSAIVESGALVANASALFARNPALRDLTIRPANRDLPALAGLAQLGQIEELKIEPENQLVAWRREWEPKPGAQLDDDALAAFLDSPYLTSVTRLSLRCASFGPASARAVARSEALAGVVRLNVEQDASMNAEAAAALAARTRRAALETLRIAHCAVGPEGCAAIAASELVAGVADVVLEACRVGNDGAKALGASSTLGACRRLRLEKNGIGDAGAAGLAGASGLGELEELDLTDNIVGDEGAKALAGAPHLDRLRILKLNQNSIGEAGAEALASTQFLPALQSLGLGNNALYGDEIEEWTDWDGTPVGSGPVLLGQAELVRRYGRRFAIT